MLAHQQLAIECNSATDNPLTDPQGDTLHGGNFQAKAVTAAMEKTRQAVQTIGRMLFTQCVEMINPSTNRGLPPNLVGEDPSTSGIFKGTDIHIAALQAELGFLSAPVNHVQTAEMGNQALNSLALISARYTHMSVNVLSELAAAHLIAVCQALDLRAMQLDFLDAYRPQFSAVVAQVLRSYSSVDGSSDVHEHLHESLWAGLMKAFDSTTHMDVKARFPAIANALRSVFMDHPSFKSLHNPLQAWDSFTANLQPSLQETWTANRDAYLVHGDASAYLAHASKKLYQFVRHSLGVPFLSTQRILTPYDIESIEADGAGKAQQANGTAGASVRAPTVGSYTGTVHRAIRDGTLVRVVVDTLGETAHYQRGPG